MSDTVTSTTAPTESESTICPNCERESDHRELVENRGVCIHCLRAFQHAHCGALLTKRRKQPAEPAHHDTVHDSFCWAENGEADGVADFDFDVIDGEVPHDQRAEFFELLGDALRRLLTWCWAGKSAHHLCTPETAAMKFMVATAAVNPGLIGGPTMKQLAASFGKTKQAASKHSRNFVGHFNFQNSHGRTEECVQRMRMAAKDSWARRKAQAANDSETTEAM
jgi:hypothetical protein